MIQKIYFTSDIHFGEPDNRLFLFDRNRVFQTSAEYENFIIENWNHTISPNDFVYFIGDFAVNEASIHKAKLLNGKKVLIKGNYDEVFANEIFGQYFDEVVNEKLIKINDETIYLNHFPNKAQKEYFNLVGHIHGLWQVQRNMINVSVDAWNYKPVSEDDIVRKMNAIRNAYDENVFAGELIQNYSFKTSDKPIIFPPDKAIVNKPVVFLAGPIKGATTWRKQLIYKLNKIENEFVIANPQYFREDFDFTQQVEWESFYLKKASEKGCIVFWLANEEENIPGRSFAQTTRFELAEWLAKKSNNPNINIVIGIDSDFSGKDYIEERIRSDFHDIAITYSLDELIEHLKSRLNRNL